ncbi:hypothetical protein [Thermoactinomyces mirandus]|uniref:hypothetical protein n=1 Tax=Thermoactinomyces mirandus TaxID=2756294 RepID=UPI0015EEB8C6|nr:hypothetical protein [Thermoactinomyces mirandus]
MPNNGMINTLRNLQIGSQSIKLRHPFHQGKECKNQAKSHGNTANNIRWLVHILEGVQKKKPVKNWIRRIRR